MEEINSGTPPVVTDTAPVGSSYGTDIRALNEMIQKESAFIDLLKSEMDKVIVGQRYMIERLLIGLLADGHILLEGVPGPGENFGHQLIVKSC